jgi:hypothetical protein
VFQRRRQNKKLLRVARVLREIEAARPQAGPRRRTSIELSRA